MRNPPMTSAVNAIPTDIEIAQKAKPRPIADVAKDIGLGLDDIDLYGKYKAKIPIEIAERPIKGRLVLVTAMNPTPAGEGKSTVTVGLTQALKRIGKNALMCMREPSMGPVFGVKGGAAGGGRSQVLPMEDINLHFTGDLHAITAAHNLLVALMDNSLQYGNPHGIDVRSVLMRRCLDMNDRSLRNI